MAQISYRQAQHTAWVNDLFDPTLSSVDAINNLVVAAATPPFDTTMYTLGVPSADTSVAGRNTKIVLTATASSNYGGTMALFYNRVPLFFAFSNTSFLFDPVTTATTIYALLPTLNTRYGVNLSQTDILDGAVAIGARQITLTVSTTSLRYLPGSTLKLITINSIQSLIKTSMLPGYDGISAALTKPKRALLMHFDGANGSKVFTDSVGHNVISNDTTLALSTANRAVGTAAVFFTNTAGQGLQIKNSSEFNLTGDCTIECWFTTAQVDFTVYPLIYKGPVTGNVGNASLLYYQNRSVTLLNENGNILFAPGTINSTTAWYHVAAVKYNGVWTMYINGVAQASTSLLAAQTWGVNSNDLWIGRSNTGNAVQTFWGGIDELAISNVARYTANFTPSTTPLVVD